MTHHIYSRYGTNPYASPPPLHDVAVCNACGGDTGHTGESLFPSFCQLCLVLLLEDDSDDY